MIDDIEDVGGGEAPAGDTAPSSEPSSDPAADLTSDIRRSLDTQRERGPDGKFVKSEGKSDVEEKPRRDEPGGAAKGIATGAPANEQDRGREADGGKPQSGVRPPPGYSVATKQAWDSLPEVLKADIAKREAEVDAGFKRYGGLGKFAEEAEKNGTTLQNAVADYVSVETEIRKDVVGGLEHLCRKIGAHPVAVLKAWLSRYVPAQGGAQGQSASQPPPQAQQIDPNAIAKQVMDVVRQETELKTINSDIASFSADPENRFFGNVRPVMARLVAADDTLNLKTAYEAACWMNPEIRAILLNEAAGGQNKAATRTAARAQNAAKAVTGAPSNSHAGDAPKKRDLDIDGEIRAAINAQRGTA
jgi:hypothetical protein